MKRMLALVAGAVMIAGSAWAVPFGDGGMALQGILDDITYDAAGNSVPSSVDVNTDALPDNGDSYWHITATGGSVATMIIEVASFADHNVFGVYNGDDYVPIFDGLAGAGDQALLSILADGTVKVNFQTVGQFSGTSFGYYLDSSYYQGGGVWHSDTARNSDDMDHLAAYQGKGDRVQIDPYAAGPWTDNEFILAWEDLDASVSDRDFTDMVLMVESVQPVPEPATMVLLGSGLLGIAGVSRRKRGKKA